MNIVVSRGKVMQAIYNEAHNAATKAILDFFQAGNREQPFNCGFAWVEIKGNTAFGKYCKAQGLASPGYPSGLQFWKPGNWPSSETVGVQVYGQDMDFHLAGALAFVTVLGAYGIEAYVRARLD